MAIIDIRNAIIQMEGSSITDLNHRNNNPGNLRYNPLHPEYTPRAIGMGEGGFARYASWDDGIQDLDRQISIDAGRDLTVSQFISKFAPAFENNTSAYLDWLKSKLGLTSGNVKLSDIIAGSGSQEIDASMVDNDSEDGSMSGEMTIALVIAGIIAGYWILK